MTKLAANPDSNYTAGYLKTLLSKRYGNHIYSASILGLKDVIYFWNMAERIVNDQW